MVAKPVPVRDWPSDCSCTQRADPRWLRHFASALLRTRVFPVSKLVQVVNVGAAEACVDVIATRVVATRMLEMSSEKSLRIWCTDPCDPKKLCCGYRKSCGAIVSNLVAGEGFEPSTVWGFTAPSCELLNSWRIKMLELVEYRLSCHLPCYLRAGSQEFRLSNPGTKLRWDQSSRRRTSRRS